MTSKAYGSPQALCHAGRRGLYSQVVRGCSNLFEVTCDLPRHTQRGSSKGGGFGIIAVYSYLLSRHVRNSVLMVQMYKSCMTHAAYLDRALRVYGTSYPQVMLSIYIYIHTYVYTYIYIYICTHICVYTYIYTYVHKNLSSIVCHHEPSERA